MLPLVLIPASRPFSRWNENCWCLTLCLRWYWKRQGAEECYLICSVNPYGSVVDSNHSTWSNCNHATMLLVCWNLILSSRPMPRTVMPVGYHSWWLTVHLRTLAPIATARLKCAHYSSGTRVPRHVSQARALRADDLCVNRSANIFVECSVTLTFFSADHFLFWFFLLGLSMLR